jgi:hypothetical protein
MAEPRFALGHLVATPGAVGAFTQAGEQPAAFIRRHAAGDWGDLDREDREENERSIKEGLRILSSYRLSDGTKIYVITEADRSSTCVLLPEEY